MHEHFAAVANSAFFQVVVLLFDDAPTAEAIENEQFSSQVQKRLIAEKTVSQQLNGKNYIIFEGIRNEIAIICSFENASDCIEKNIAAQISLCLKENGIGATLCIGQSVNDISDIQKSYWAAHNLIKSRFIFGLSSVLDQQDEDALITSAFVIQNRLDKILKALTGCDRESLVSEINDIFDLLQNCCYDLAILVINTILYHIVETVDHLLKSESEGIENFNLNNIQTNLSRLQTLEESRNYLLTISLALTQKIEATRDNGKYALYLSIMEYIEHNIGRHDLSLNLIGEQFNLSAGYASKIFNSLHHTGITEFISQLRVESAKKLLTDTNKTISQISKEIGFQSSAYFITIFKKHVGSTPNVYRKTTKNTFLPP
jgi:YesN/AraC family two-component response regulator